MKTVQMIRIYFALVLMIFTLFASKFKYKKGEAVKVYVSDKDDIRDIKRIR